MCRASWALHTRLLISFANCVRHWGCGWARHCHGCAAQRGKAGLGQLRGVHQAPKVPALSLPSDFLQQAAEGSSCLLFLLWGGNTALRLGKASQRLLPQQPLPSPAAEHRHSTRHLTGCSHHREMHMKSQSFLVIQPASVTQPGPSSSSSSAPSF